MRSGVPIPAGKGGHIDARDAPSFRYASSFFPFHLRRLTVTRCGSVAVADGGAGCAGSASTAVCSEFVWERYPSAASPVAAGFGARRGDGSPRLAFFIIINFIILNSAVLGHEFMYTHTPCPDPTGHRSARSDGFSPLPTIRRIRLANCMRWQAGGWGCDMCSNHVCRWAIPSLLR